MEIILYVVVLVIIAAFLVIRGKGAQKRPPLSK
jgi:hypothetical protein